MGWLFYTDRRVQTYADEKAEITRLCTFEGDTRKTYLVKDGDQKVGILRMDTLVKSLVPTEAADDGIRAR
mgnify:CR=1 FL=1